MNLDGRQARASRCLLAASGPAGAAGSLTDRRQLVSKSYKEPTVRVKPTDARIIRMPVVTPENLWCPRIPVSWRSFQKEGSRFVLLLTPNKMDKCYLYQVKVTLLSTLMLT